MAQPVLSTPTRVTIAYHGHCFDGMSSAALLTRFLRHREPGSLEFRYCGLDHQPGGSFVPEDVLDGDINAVVDFRYSMSERLTWWFDHHGSALKTSAERSHFAQDSTGQRFLDASYSSCCKLISDVTQAQFGWREAALDELVRWADIIDGARFDSPRTPVELREPALQLMTVIEVHGNSEFLAPRIAQLANGAPLAGVAGHESVQRLFRPLRVQQERTRERIRDQADVRGRVASFDLVGCGSDRYNKFIPYELFPDADYTVAVTSGPTRAKVSIGWNPWSPRPRQHDVSVLCEEFGGGGHATVGAISLEADQVARAREVAATLASRLRA